MLSPEGEDIASFGRSVQLAGDTALIGAPYHNAFEVRRGPLSLLVIVFLPDRGEKASPKPGGDAETFTLSFRHLFGTAPSRLRTTLTAPVASPQSSTCRGTTKGQVPSLCTSARASSAKTSRRRSICMRPTVLRRHCSDRRWRMTGSGPSLGRRTMTRGARPQAHKVAGGSSFGENKRGSASRLIGERRRSVVFFLVPRQVWQELRVCLSLHQE